MIDELGMPSNQRRPCWLACASPGGGVTCAIASLLMEQLMLMQAWMSSHSSKPPRLVPVAEGPVGQLARPCGKGDVHPGPAWVSDGRMNEPAAGRPHKRRQKEPERFVVQVFKAIASTDSVGAWRVRVPYRLPTVHNSGHTVCPACLQWSHESHRFADSWRAVRVQSSDQSIDDWHQDRQ